LIQHSIPGYFPEYDTYIRVLQDPNNLNECYFTISVRFPEDDNITGLLVKYNTHTKEILSERFTKYRRFCYDAEIWDQILLVTSIAHGNINMCAVDKDTLQYQNVAGGCYGGLWLVDNSTDMLYREGCVEKNLYIYAFNKNLETIWKYETPSEEIKDYVNYLLKSFLYQDQVHVFYSLYEKAELLKIKHLVLDANGKLIFQEVIGSDFLSFWERNMMTSQGTASRIFQKDRFVWITSQKENEAWIEKYTIEPSGSLKLIWKKTVANANIHGRDLHFMKYQQQSFLVLCFDEISSDSQDLSETDSKNKKSTKNGNIICLNDITGDTLWTKSLPFSLQNIQCDMNLQEKGNMQIMVPNVPYKEGKYNDYFLQLNLQDGTENAKQSLLNQNKFIVHRHKGFYYLFDSEDQSMYVVNQVDNRYQIKRDQSLIFSDLQFYSMGDQLYILVKETESGDEINHDRNNLYRIINSPH
jgi:outer membrane protein assembly factor BamB